MPTWPDRPSATSAASRSGTVFGHALAGLVEAEDAVREVGRRLDPAQAAASLDENGPPCGEWTALSGPLTSKKLPAWSIGLIRLGSSTTTPVSRSHTKAPAGYGLRAFADASMNFFHPPAARLRSINLSKPKLAAFRAASRPPR